MSTPSFRIDHVGIVVPDLDAAVEFYTRAFGMTVVSTEAPTDVDTVAIGIDAPRVRLCGAILSTGNARLELHQYLEPVGDTHREVYQQGIGHFAFDVDDIDEAYEHLTKAGVTFNSTPNRIDVGDLAGRQWVYGQDPWGNVIELGQNPKVA